MPKTFSDSERAYIRGRLIEEAKVCLAQYGIRKTTVDELVRRVNIPKGTFYLFYDSKELLFFDVLCVLHDEMQEKMLAELAALKGGADADKLTDILLRLYRSLDSSFILRLMTNGELELLFRRLPPELNRRHAELDDFQMIALVPGLDSEHVRLFSAALRGVFVSVLFKREIGEDIFDDALKIMLRGVVGQIYEAVTK